MKKYLPLIVFQVGQVWACNDERSEYAQILSVHGRNPQIQALVGEREKFLSTTEFQTKYTHVPFHHIDLMSVWILRTDVLALDVKDDENTYTVCKVIGKDLEVNRDKSIRFYRSDSPDIQKMNFEDFAKQYVPCPERLARLAPTTDHEKAAVKVGQLWSRDGKSAVVQIAEVTPKQVAYRSVIPPHKGLSAAPMEVFLSLYSIKAEQEDPADTDIGKQLKRKLDEAIAKREKDEDVEIQFLTPPQFLVIELEALWAAGCHVCQRNGIAEVLHRNFPDGQCHFVVHELGLRYSFDNGDQYKIVNSLLRMKVPFQVV